MDMPLTKSVGTQTECMVEYIDRCTQVRLKVSFSDA